TGINTTCNPRQIFFFQAEDGIRDLIVTGVQTCALPILQCDDPASSNAWTASESNTPPKSKRNHCSKLLSVVFTNWIRVSGRKRRSEERRVGKECRWLGSPEAW